MVAEISDSLWQRRWVGEGCVEHGIVLEDKGTVFPAFEDFLPDLVVGEQAPSLCWSQVGGHAKPLSEGFSMGFIGRDCGGMCQ